MKYTVSKSVVWIVGRIWMPPIICAQAITLDPHDQENMLGYREADPYMTTREALEHWLSLNCGDFQEIIDFSASLEINGETVQIPWQDDDNELVYQDCMSPFGEDDAE